MVPNESNMTYGLGGILDRLAKKSRPLRNERLR